MSARKKVPSRALEQTMAGAAEVRPTPALAFVRAREIIRSGQKLDMRTLALDIGVGRSTLYRWTEDRDQLLADVTWTELDAILEHLKETTPGEGTAFMTQVAAEFLGVLADNAGLQAFFVNEGDHGLRLVTAPGGPFRPRMVAGVQRMVDEQVESGAYRPPDDPRVLADGIVCLGERFLYHGGDPKLNPDPETAKRLIALLLREPAES